MAALLSMCLFFFAAWLRESERRVRFVHSGP
jgi:hypothetical protein